MTIHLRITRSPKWLQAVREIEHCVRCGRHGVQAAHRNQGKGMSLKVPDCLTAALCPQCHHEIDNGREMTLDERRREMDLAVILTIEKLFTTGKVVAR